MFLGLLLANQGRSCRRSAYIILLIQKSRTCLQIRTTKAERFAVETHHFKIQHAEITKFCNFSGNFSGHEIPSPVFRFRLTNPALTLSLTLTQTPLPQLTARSHFMAGAWS